MSPPTEQLIRDYLNRLSVAARGQLGPDDRRALITRTRDFIERKTGLAGPPTAVEVARLLSGLGDPAGLVTQEVRRLAALRGEEMPEPVSKGSFLDRVLRRDPGTPASWHWPTQPGSRTDLQLRLIDPAGTVDARPSSAANGAAGPGSARQRGRGDQARPAAAAGDVPLPASGPGDAGGAAAEPAGADSPPGGLDGPAAPGGRGSASAEPSLLVSGQPGPQDRPVHRLTIVPPPPDPAPATTSEPAPADRTRGLRGVAAQRVTSWAAAVSAWARGMPLEAAAVVLLGVGGAAFPPVWLAGVAVAVASKVWDYRDKWLGLGAPVLLTLFGAVAGLAAAGNQGTLDHHVHLAWSCAVVVSRVSAAAGAAYLAWRSVHDKKEPEVPPWRKPRKVT